MSLASMTPAQKKAYFGKEDQLIYSMFQIFAQGPAKYAGLEATQKGCTTGIKAVFDWWCANGVLLGGEKDLKDVAAQVAETIASAIYEPDTTAVCMQELMPYMAQKSCGTPAQGTMYSQTAPRSRSVQPRMRRAGRMSRR